MTKCFTTEKIQLEPSSFLCLSRNLPFNKSLEIWRFLQVILTHRTFTTPLGYEKQKFNIKYIKWFVCYHICGWYQKKVVAFFHRMFALLLAKNLPRSKVYENLSKASISPLGAMVSWREIKDMIMTESGDKALGDMVLMHILQVLLACHHIWGYCDNLI